MLFCINKSYFFNKRIHRIYFFKIIVNKIINSLFLIFYYNKIILFSFINYNLISKVFVIFIES